MNDKPKLIAVTKLSTRGTSIRMTIPKTVAKELELEEGQFIGFYQFEDRIFIKKLD